MLRTRSLVSVASRNKPQNPAEPTVCVSFLLKCSHIPSPSFQESSWPFHLTSMIDSWDLGDFFVPMSSNPGSAFLNSFAQSSRLRSLALNIAFMARSKHLFLGVSTVDRIEANEGD